MNEIIDIDKIYDDLLEQYINKFGHEPVINRTFGNILDKLKRIDEALINNTPLIPVKYETDVLY